MEAWKGTRSWTGELEDQLEPLINVLVDAGYARELGTFADRIPVGLHRCRDRPRGSAGQLK